MNINTDTRLLNTINTILLRLEEKGINCAIRRNADTRGVPLKGDVDIVVDRKDIETFIRVLHENSHLFRVSVSYGGLKTWIEIEPGVCKQVDFIWRVSKSGIVIMGEEQIRKITTSSIREEGIPILPPKSVGEMIFAEKKKQEDYQRYDKELAAAGLQGLGKYRRIFWLIKIALKSPAKTIINNIRLFLVRCLRIFYPTGISVYSFNSQLLVDSKVLKYIFGNKIHPINSLFAKIFLRNIKGGLAIVNNGRADVIISDKVSLEAAERIIIDYLTNKRTNVPKLIEILA